MKRTYYIGLDAHKDSVAIAHAIAGSRASAQRDRHYDREIVLGVTYVIVIFSILVQGLSLGRVARRVVKG